MHLGSVPAGRVIYGRDFGGFGDPSGEDMYSAFLYQARKHVDRALELDPNNVEALNLSVWRPASLTMASQQLSPATTPTLAFGTLSHWQ
jgi:hypothetical protein